jgi:GNAT superfamily N-acetyltransferase
VRTIAEGLERSIQEQLGANTVLRFSLFVRTASGEVVGGLNARVAFGNLHVDQVWCDESIRVRGYATRLLTRAEKHALENGATAAVLNTLDRDLVTFYGRRGYRLIGEVDGLLGGRSVFFMRKELAASREQSARSPSSAHTRPVDEVKESA